MRVLYITYTGLLDPLGQSQVLQYVLALGRRGAKITVLSFEKAARLRDGASVAALHRECAMAGVVWCPRTWHNRPVGILATLYDVVFGSLTAVRIARRTRAQVVHCRSYLGGLMGLVVKRLVGSRLIFDMRGFWPDERVDGGIWTRRSFVYRVFKRVERALFLGADHVISLTRAGAREFLGFPYLCQDPPPYTVIPTCTNLQLFRVRPSLASSKGLTLGYVGSVGSWYLFSDVARAFARAASMTTGVRFLIVTQGDHDFVRATLAAAGVDLELVTVRAAEFSEVGSLVSEMDAGVFFIRPAWSKKASCPTRMGEFLGAGKPCLTNGGVGDVAEDLGETRTGIALPPLDETGVDLAQLDEALKELLAMIEEPGTAERCRLAAEQRFSLEGGVQAYFHVYSELCEAVP